MNTLKASYAFNKTIDTHKAITHYNLFLQSI